ncbi:MAG: thiamine phosphate synthase [Acidobacteriota bacterium]
MKLNPQKRLIYLITSGETNPQTTPAAEQFSNVLRLIEAAVAAGIDLVQIREKRLSAKVLYALSEAAAQITRGSSTGLLVNDRADIAAAAGAQGVHLSTRSLSPQVVRRTFGDQFLIGVSTHSLDQASFARAQGADLAVLGPIFETSSKRQYGEPLGIEELRRVASQLTPFPILALGGIAVSRVAACIRAGASGIAAISLLNDARQLRRVVNEIRSSFDEPG